MKSRSISTTQALAVALLLQGVANAAESPAAASADADAAPASQPTSIQAHVAQALRVAQAAEPATAPSQNIQLAQAASPAAADNPDELAEVSVTGSRIVARPGYEAPTPLTVLSAEDLVSPHPCLLQLAYCLHTSLHEITSIKVVSRSNDDLLRSSFDEQIRLPLQQLHQ